MAYFPLFIELKDAPCLIIGGGEVAFRKAEALLLYGAAITVIAKEFCEDFSSLKTKITMLKKPYEVADLKEGTTLVIVATDDTALNRDISKQCNRKNIPVNVVDVKEECSFFFPSIVKRGDLSVGISTGGKSPVVAKLIRKQIEEIVSEEYEKLANGLGEYRERIKEEVADGKVRHHVFHELASKGLENSGQITKEMVDEILKKQDK